MAGELPRQLRLDGKLADLKADLDRLADSAFWQYHRAANKEKDSLRLTKELWLAHPEIRQLYDARGQYIEPPVTTQRVWLFWAKVCLPIKFWLYNYPELLKTPMPYGLSDLPPTDTVLRTFRKYVEKHGEKAGSKQLEDFDSSNA